MADTVCRLPATGNVVHARQADVDLFVRVVMRSGLEPRTEPTEHKGVDLAHHLLNSDVRVDLQFWHSPEVVQDRVGRLSAQYCNRKDTHKNGGHTSSVRHSYLPLFVVSFVVGLTTGA